MHYHILTVDYDGTLAKDNHVPSYIILALAKLKATGRKLVLATGRVLEDLLEIFPQHVLFDRIVAENGAVLYIPATKEIRLLAEKPPQELIGFMKDKHVPLSTGHVIVSTWEPHQQQALDAVRLLGIEYQLIFNKGAVMILPPGINKASGLLEALRDLGVSSHNNVVIGDAENDHAMLMTAEFSAAVANALPKIKSTVDWISVKSYGDGVEELIDLIIKDDLKDAGQHVRRHDLLLGTTANGNSFYADPKASCMLLSGTSSCGKTTIAAAMVEQLVQSHYQLCLIDPEGDYIDAAGVVNIGDSTQIPLIDNVIELLRQPMENVSVCLLAVPLAERPDFFKQLLAQVCALRQQKGHPHFLIMDEAHHLMPKEYSGEASHFFQEIDSFLAITTRCELLHPHFLKYVNTAMMMGTNSKDQMQSFLKTTDGNNPDGSDNSYGNLLVWRNNNNQLIRVKAVTPVRLLNRHKRKYATGDMAHNSFYFRGWDCKLNLKAQNLFVFIQLGEGVDDETWLFHLHRHDYSNWFRNSIKNAELADHTEVIERESFDAMLSRKEIFNLIRTYYTSHG